jgi:hypothetical protein
MAFFNNKLFCDTPKPPDGYQSLTSSAVNVLPLPQRAGYYTTNRGVTDYTPTVKPVNSTKNQYSCTSNEQHNKDATKTYHRILK